MSQEVKDKLLCEITSVFCYYDARISNLEKELEKHRHEISGLEAKCTDLITKNNEVKEELASFSKVSIIKSLNKSLLDKEGEIKFLESKLRNAKTSKDEPPQLLNEVKMIGDEPEAVADTVAVEEPVAVPEAVAPEPVAEAAVTDTEDEEVEVDFIIKKLRGKEYYVTDDKDREIYEKLDDDEVGELIGKYNEKGRATFFKKK